MVTASELQARLEAIRKELAQRSLYHFVRQAWSIVEPAPFVDNWHIGAICEHLQAVTAGQISRLLINIPPGCSKSLLTCVFWPMWEWANNPSVRWFFASYDQHLSTRDSVKCRALIQSQWYRRRWGRNFRLTGDQNQKTYYETDKHGYRMATSIGGHGLGEHPDRIVVDDPHDIRGAESQLELLSTLEWWDLTMTTRGVSRDARRVIIMQRLKDNDLSAHVIKEGGWEHICLPMRYEPGRMKTTSLGWNDPRTNDGELLTPGQFSEEKVADMERKLGTYGVAGQLQQRPYPAGGALIKAQWFRRYTDIGDAYRLDDRQMVIRHAELWTFAIMDPAVSTKKTADYTAIGVFQVWQPRLYLIVRHMVRERLGPEEIVPRLNQICGIYQPMWVAVEANNFQVFIAKEARSMEPAPGSAVQGWRKKYPNIPEVKELKPAGPKGERGKGARAGPLITKFENGEIYLPEDDMTHPWVGPLEDELVRFTGKGDEHDDQVDCLSYSVLSLQMLGFTSDPGEPLIFGERRPIPQGIGVWG